MKFMINFTHIDGAWEKLTPSELENIQAQHKEFVGGYFIMEADSMDDAVEFAKRGRYMFGANEIREIVE